jgi:hypothetical protein
MVRPDAIVIALPKSPSRSGIASLRSAVKASHFSPPAFKAGARVLLSDQSPSAPGWSLFQRSCSWSCAARSSAEISAAISGRRSHLAVTRREGLGRFVLNKHTGAARTMSSSPRFLVAPGRPSMSPGGSNYGRTLPFSPDFEGTVNPRHDEWRQRACKVVNGRSATNPSDL